MNVGPDRIQHFLRQLNDPREGYGCLELKKMCPQKIDFRKIKKKHEEI